jgi:hypothetical protein
MRNLASEEGDEFVILVLSIYNDEYFKVALLFFYFF